eukprot:g2658.t1
MSSEKKKQRVASSASSSSARSLDDDDENVPMAASAAAALGIVHDPHAVKLCASLLSLLEQLKQLAGVREERVSRFAEEKPCADVYEVSLDRTRGSLSVSCLQQRIEGLDAATTDARENLAHEIAQRKADITGLEAEVAKLGRQIQDSQGEGAEAILLQLCSVHAMIGKHREALSELESKSELEVKESIGPGRTEDDLTDLQQEKPRVGIISHVRNHCTFCLLLRSTTARTLPKRGGFWRGRSHFFVQVAWENKN